MRNLLELDYPAERLQIVVVSDGSTDGTECDSCASKCANPRVQVVYQPAGAAGRLRIEQGMRGSGERSWFSPMRARRLSAARCVC